MLIKKHEIERPDSDGDCSIHVEFEIENEHEEDVMLIKHEVHHLNEGGYIVASNTRNSHYCLIEKGDAEELSVWTRTHARHLAKDKSVTARIQARLFKREFFKLGAFKVPETDGVTWLDADVDSRLVEGKIKITTVRHEPDDDGEVRIELFAYVKNKTQGYLEDCEMNVSLLDRAGAQIESGLSASDLPPDSAVCLEPSLWGIKPKKLKGASMEISITLYTQIGAATIEGATRFSG